MIVTHVADPFHVSVKNIGLGLPIKIDHSSTKIGDNSDATKETWSQLPSLLLWMIKDRLDFVSNVRLAAVCRNWWSASSSYQKKNQSVGERIPWIMQVINNSGTGKFICVSTREKFSIHVPELCGDTAVLFSRQGWLLVLRQNTPTPKREIVPDNVFLVNPFTKSKIKLPELGDSFCQIVGSFSTFEGNPNCVALAMLESLPVYGITLRVVYPGDNMWTEHYNITQGLFYDCFGDLVIKGNHVYALDKTGRMLVYDMQSRVGKVLPMSNPVCRCHLVERGGEILKFERRKRRVDLSSLLHIFRYNAAEFAWEKLNVDEVMKDTSWFYSDYRSCFVANDEGMKIYSLQRERDESGLTWQEARVYDSVDGGSFHMLFAEYRLSPFAMWVDVG